MKFKHLFLFVLLSNALHAATLEMAQVAATALRVLQAWRSSDRYIPGGIVRQQMETYVPAELRREMLKHMAGDLVPALIPYIQEASLDKGTVENLMKIWLINYQCSISECPFEKDSNRPIARQEDAVRGMPKGEDLEGRLAPFPDGPPNGQALAGAYKFYEDLLIQESVSEPTKNDHYAFTIPGLFFGLGFHKTYEVVFENTSRGADDFPFMISFGQDQVTDMLENLKFREWEVQAIRRRVSTKWKIEPAFWDYLRQWRFTGNVRGLRPGTIAFAGLPALNVITDPVSGLIIESKINPLMSSYTKWMTNIVRVVIAKGGIKSLQEAGTRRVITGTLSAMTALFAGVEGTSNVFAAELLGKYSYGTTPHSGVMMFPFEDEFFQTVLEHVIGEALMLPDTYNILDGLRKAILAGGGERVHMVRQDSNAYNPETSDNLTTEETVLEILNVWRDLGRPNNPHAVTNDQNEASLVGLAAEVGQNVSMVSVGGAVAAGSGPTHGNYVYKLVQRRDLTTGKVSYPVKVANGAKSTEPGEKDVFRFYDEHGIMKRDLKILRGRPAPEGGEALFTDLMRDGRRVLERARPDTSAPYIWAQVAKLPPDYRTLFVDEGGKKVKQTRSRLAQLDRRYPVESSDELVQIRDHAIADTIPPEEYRVLTIFGSFDPAVDSSHIAMAYRLAELARDQSNPKGYDKVLFIPASAKPAHGKTYRLHDRARITLLEQKIETARRDYTAEIATRNSKLDHPLPDVEVWDGETNYTGTEAPYTYDTLGAIQRRYRSAKLTVAVGEDVFFSIARKSAPWKDARPLLAEYDWMVLKRPDLTATVQVQRDRADTLEMVTDFTKREFLWTSPQGHKIRFFDARLPDVSSTQVREFYDQLGIAARVHSTDPMETFFWRSARPIAGHTENGALAVEGTEKTVDAIVDVNSRARRLTTFVETTSSDAHVPEEKTFRHLNEPEFHIVGFPLHGVKGEEGPRGDAFIPEVEKVFPRAQQIRIPSLRLKWNGDRPAWEEVPFSLNDLGRKLFDPHYVLRFEKQGAGSYDVFTNRHYLEYLEKLDPYRVLAHFHVAWATDYCFYSVLKGELRRGFRSIVIVDAIAGVAPRRSADRLRELEHLGAKFMTSADFDELSAKWEADQSAGHPATWSDVLNDIADWESTKGMKTREWLKKELARYRPLNPGEEETPSEAVFQRKSRRPPPPEALGGCETTLTPHAA